MQLDSHNDASRTVTAQQQVNGAIILLVLGVISVVRRILLFSKLQRQRDAELEVTCRRAISMTKTFSYPAVFVRGTEFVKLDKLTVHEELREAGQLVTRDALNKLSTKEQLIFYSHQWTSPTEPDPTGRQFQVMVAALHSICAMQDWQLDNVLIWVDYSSIPQVCRSVQALAINSLTAYASHAKVFIIVAPEVNHAVHGGVLGYDTYQRRMWCRAEQLCHALSNSTSAMYLATDAEAVPVCKRTPI